MAVLSDANRARVWRGLMRFHSTRRDGLALTKAEFRAAVNATDQWIDDNAAAYNAAIPQPARGALTAGEKNILFCAVALIRCGEVDLLRRALSEEVE